MLIKRRSPFSDKENELEIDVNDFQMKKWQSGTSIQIAMPHLSADAREFIMTGITAEEWNKLFNEEWDKLFNEDNV